MIVTMNPIRGGSANDGLDQWLEVDFFCFACNNLFAIWFLYVPTMEICTSSFVKYRFLCIILNANVTTRLIYGWCQCGFAQISHESLPWSVLKGLNRLNIIHQIIKKRISGSISSVQLSFSRDCWRKLVFPFR